MRTLCVEQKVALIRPYQMKDIKNSDVEKYHTF